MEFGPEVLSSGTSTCPHTRLSELDGRLSRSRDRHVLAHVPSRWSAVAGPVGTLSFTLRLKKRFPIDISHARRLDRLLATPHVHVS
jgi:hypothetical protein